MHNNRSPDDGVVHSNDGIDNERTAQNYYFKRGTPKDVTKRTDEVCCLNRDDLVVIGEMVVTLPQNVKEEDEKKFFQSVYDFYSADFGEKNIVNAVVHKDEKTPHIHLDFVPVITSNEPMNGRYMQFLSKWKKEHNIGENEEYERLCCKDLINKTYLDQMHIRLSDYVSEELGYEVEILNGATSGGNKTVQELKLQKITEQLKSLEADKENLEHQIAEKKDNLNNVHKTMRDLGISNDMIGTLPLLQKISYLETKVKVLQQIVLKNRCSYTREDLEAMKPPSITGAAGAVLNVFDGSISDMAIDNNSIIVIEMYDESSGKVSPQKELIDRSSEITIQMNFAKRIKEPVVLRKSRMTERRYLFIKNDDPKDIINLLIRMGQVLEKELKESKKKIYMDKIEADEYDFAKAVLSKLDTEVVYCTTLQKEEKEEEQEETKDNQKTE